MNPAPEPCLTLVWLDKDDELDIESDWLDETLYRDWIDCTLALVASDAEAVNDSNAAAGAIDVDAASGSMAAAAGHDRDAANGSSIAAATDASEYGNSTRELSIRLCSTVGMQRLNREYRGRNTPTNVLSFPSGLSPLSGNDGVLWPLGDLALCPTVVIEEAMTQGKSVAHHRAHMIVHGVLHLMGHDHVEDAAAEAMEQLEIRILSRAMVPNPYSEPATDE